MIALDLELGDAADGTVRAEATNEAVDLAGGQVALTGRELAEVAGGRLGQADGLDFRSYGAPPRVTDPKSWA